MVKFKLDTPLICGHKGPIQDLDFSPFHSNILATASSDGTCKIWMIPEGGYTKNQAECDAELKGHSKKVSLLKFHPSANFTMASCGMECAVKIWDIQSENVQMSFDAVNSSPWGMDWNYDGSKIGLISKDKQLHIFDPRQPEQAMSTQAHEGNKAQRFKWLGNTGNILTSGFSEYNERQYAVFDTRAIEKPLTMRKLDTQNQVSWLHYDDASKVVYVVNKG